MPFVKVILPVKMHEALTYSVPEELTSCISVGAWVEVYLKGKLCIGVILEVTNTIDFNPDKLKPVINFLDYPFVRETEIALWKDISTYYMCSLGEIFKAAKPLSLQGIYTPSARIQASKLPKLSPIPTLSPAQARANEDIAKLHKEKKIVLLNGITGSGKTEIYIHQIKECLESGKNALYLLPEVAISQQLSHRLEKIFQDKVLVFHSKQTLAKRRLLLSKLREQGPEQAYLVVGLRSAVFLPFKHLGLIIIDEEHDSSYKQDSPNPRYNGRDAAIFLSRIFNSRVILGSATPSFESLHNVNIGRFTQVMLSERYHSSKDAILEIVDMKKEARKRAIKGLFSYKVIDEIKHTLGKGEQCLVFRSRRAYSTSVLCQECGDIPQCPRCNVYLSYHNFNSSLSCHHCNYKRSVKRNEQKELFCSKCSSYLLKPIGSGTEMIEDEMKILFSEARVARFDSDTASTKTQQDKLIKDFTKGDIDILVGTQMITKGFDFENLTLVVVIQAESLFAIPNFRSDEKALSLFIQLMGRSGRREKQGKLLIQTYQPEHNVFTKAENLLQERKEFLYPPYVRLITISIKHRNTRTLNQRSREVQECIKTCGIQDYIGPIPAPIEMKNKEHIVQFHLHLKRDQNLGPTKARLFNALSEIKLYDICIDVDP